MTQILKSGPPGKRRNIAVLGDGFTEAEQDKYNAAAENVLLGGVFGHQNGYFWEDKQAFNIFRVNLISNASGVSQRRYDEKGTSNIASDDTIISTTLKDTPLAFIYSGSWAHCWLEMGTDKNGVGTDTLIQNALDKWVPDYDLVLIILNEPGFGGCGGGGRQVVTLNPGQGWPVMAHEFGHGAGGLADEYCTARKYTGGEPGAVNVTTNNVRTTLKWKQFVDPTTPVPTGKKPRTVTGCTNHNQGTRPRTWDSNQDVGIFEGGSTYDEAVYRPVENCRMNGNTPKFCPVCYTELKRIHHPFTERNFLKCYAGDFNGDGKDDLLIHNGTGIMIYRSNGSQLDLVFSEVEKVPSARGKWGWQFQADDQFFVADFNGDGKDEVVVFNATNWGSHKYLALLVDDGKDGLKRISRYHNEISGWPLRPNDRFFVADFNGDGKKDLFVFNSKDWSVPYFGMLRSTGTGFVVEQRYEGNIRWIMKPDDQFFVGDFDGNGKDDLLVFNSKNWSRRYAGLFISTGTSLGYRRLFTDTISSWQLQTDDQFYVGDFNGDGKDDLFIFNGTNWKNGHFGMLKSEGTNFSVVQNYEGNIPGWSMRKADQFLTCDIKGTGKTGLFVYNFHDWSYDYIGTLISTGTALQGRWYEENVGEWTLNPDNQFIVCNFEGVAGRRNLFVHTEEFFGMLKANPGLSLIKMYKDWIHNYRFGRNW